MPEYTRFLEEIRHLIAQDEIPMAIQKLQQLLENSPKLDEVILQSGRHQDVLRQIRLGITSDQEVNLVKNKIRLALLELISDIETGTNASAEIQQEISRAGAVLRQKNVVTGHLSAGGNIHIGDNTTQVLESSASRRLRFYLFFLVPFLTILVAFLWYQLQYLQESFSYTVQLNNKTPNPELPFQSGNIVLQLGDRKDVKKIETEVVFTGIPARFRNKKVGLKFESPGFIKMDTVIVLSDDLFVVPIHRDNSLERIFGTVKDEQGDPVAGAQVVVQDITARTDAAGNFLLRLPFDKQRTTQRIRVIKAGYLEWDNISPVFEHEAVYVILRLK